MPVMTIGMIFHGRDAQVASATIPGFSTCASICPKPACSTRWPAPSGIKTPAGRINGFTTSPGRINRGLPSVSKNLQLVDVALRDDPRIAPLQLFLHLQLILGLLIVALRLLQLSLCLGDVHACGDERGINLGYFAPGGLDGRFLFRTVQPEQHGAFGNRRAVT